MSFTDNDPIPEHLKFGYATNKKKDAIRQKLIDEGYEPNSVELRFAVERKYEENSRGNLTYRQRQDLARWRGEKWVTPNPKPPMPNLSFTLEELEMLIEKFTGTNTEIGQSVLNKALTEMEKYRKD